MHNLSQFRRVSNKLKSIRTQSESDLHYSIICNEVRENNWQLIKVDPLFLCILMTFFIG